MTRSANLVWPLSAASAGSASRHGTHVQGLGERSHAVSRLSGVGCSRGSDVVWLFNDPHILARELFAPLTHQSARRPTRTFLLGVLCARASSLPPPWFSPPPLWRTVPLSSPLVARLAPPPPHFRSLLVARVVYHGPTRGRDLSARHDQRSRGWLVDVAAAPLVLAFSDGGCCEAHRLGQTPRRHRHRHLPLPRS